MIDINELRSMVNGAQFESFANSVINQRLSPIALSVAGLTQLGIQPVGKDRAAVLYLESDVARICSVLIRHLTTVARGEIKEAA